MTPIAGIGTQLLAPTAGMIVEQAQEAIALMSKNNFCSNILEKEAQA